MTISIITPLHEAGNSYINKAWKSLQKQSYQDFEWIILQNNGGDASCLPDDKRIIKLQQAIQTDSIGLLKSNCCNAATGEYILELDADDTLSATALGAVVEAFSKNPDVNFVYSDCFEINSAGNTEVFSPYWGWKHNEAIVNGKKQKYNRSFPAIPQALRQIYWSPNHLRAWRTSAYREIGGHNTDLAVGDDHELMLRFFVEYGEKGFYHIEEPLYNYFLHNGNTFKAKAETIANQSWFNYYKYKEPMVLKWAKDNNLLAVDLCGGINPYSNEYKTADKRETADYNLDLDGDWAWEENSVGVFRASDALEHLKNPIDVMNKAYKALAPGGWLFIAVPSTDGRGAFQDPTHISFWNENSFWYYTNERYAKFIPEFEGKFQVASLQTLFPTEWHKRHNIPYVYADLIAIKDGYKPVGESLWNK